MTLCEMRSKLVHGESPQEKQHENKQRIFLELNKIYKMKNKIMVEKAAISHKSPGIHMQQ